MSTSEFVKPEFITLECGLCYLSYPDNMLENHDCAVHGDKSKFIDSHFWHDPEYFGSSLQCFWCGGVDKSTHSVKVVNGRHELICP